MNGSCPELITKKYLCYRFGLLAGQRPNYPLLYSRVLTPDVLHQLGATEKEIRVRNFKTFTRTQSLILIKVLAL